MPFPASVVWGQDKTVTDDYIIAPGALTVFIEGSCASVVGDVVIGEFIIGVCAINSPTVFFEGLQATRITSVVIGVCTDAPIVPVATIVAMGIPTVLVA